MSITDFYFGIVWLTTLLLTTSALRPRCITCPCGSMINPLKYTHCLKDSMKENTCKRWVNCETCEANLTYCLTCPKGRSGLTCAKEKKVFCRHPDVRLNSRLTTPTRRNQKFLPLSHLVYACKEGYKTRDHQVIKCLNSGQWSSPPPTCDKIVSKTKQKIFCKCLYPRPNSRLVTPISRDGKFLPGSQLVYACKEGYKTLDSQIIKCMNSGRWSSFPPTCNRIVQKTKRRIFCRYPELGPNVRLITSFNKDKKFFPGIQLLYVCDEGYKHRGRPVIKCLDSGQWSSPPPTCNRIVPETIIKGTPCAYPDIDVTGMIVESYPNITDKRKMFDPGSRIQFDCEDGYELVENEWIIYCTVKGEWTRKPPTCEAVVESRAIIGSNSFPVFRSPPVFNSNKIPKICPDPPVGPNNVIEEIPSNDPRRRGQGFEPGSEVNITCKDGYEMQGDSLIICLQNGEWANPPPRCRRIPRTANPATFDVVQCTDLGPIANGLITVYESTIRPRRRPFYKNHTYPAGSRLEYKCIEGYRLQGKRRLNCKFTGQWSEEKPTCIAECGHSSIRSNYPVFNGTKTTPGEWPWTVAIADNENTTKFQCTGVLLNRNTVLTVAHCVEQDGVYTLFFGIFNFANGTKDRFVQERKSCRIVLNPELKSKSSGNDIAIVTFEPPIRFTEMVQPICLPTPATTARNLVPGEKGYVSGWDLPMNVLASKELQMIQIPVLSEETCMEGQRNKRVSLARIPSGTFCSVVQEGIDGFCSMTSGSPMVFYNAENRRYILEGLVSWRLDATCERRESYITLTRVADFTQWILEILQTQESCS